jgi:hypothetical protein
VPNDRCTKRCFGDERFYSNEEWIYMLNEAGLEVKECLHRGLERGKYVGNCSIFLAGDREDNQCMHQKRDVYDYY